MRYALCFLIFLSLTDLWCQENHYNITDGSVSFKSNAPLEIIQAESSKLKGIIDPEKNTFAFIVKTNSFEGFNAPLQRVHFNENYMESSTYPNCIFTGKIIEEIDFDQPGKYTVRAKGKLEIHGVSQERIIKSELISENGSLVVSTFFTVLLKEHDIAIPKIVHQKIAEEIEVTIKARLSKK